MYSEYAVETVSQSDKWISDNAHAAGSVAWRRANYVVWSLKSGEGPDLHFLTWPRDHLLSCWCRRRLVQFAPLQCMAPLEHLSSSSEISGGAISGGAQSGVPGSAAEAFEPGRVQALSPVRRPRHHHLSSRTHHRYQIPKP